MKNPSSRSLYLKVSRTYKVALLIIGLVAISTFTIIYVAMTSKAEYAELINVSGRQRMLSQRVALLATQYAEHDSNQRKETLDLLIASRDLFDNSHRLIISGSICPKTQTYLSKDVEAVFFGEIQLDNRVHRFIDKVNLLIELDSFPEKQTVLAHQIQAEAKLELLTDLDRVVKLFEEEAIASDNLLLKIEFCLLLFLLGGLACEARFIFAPMAHLVANTMNDLAESTKQIEWAADHDALTKIANRRKLSDEIDKHVKLSATTGHQIAVLHLDLDKFKAVNDTFGHAAGDAVLTSVAEKLTAIVPEDSVVARVGGDEFTLLLKQAPSEAELSKLAENIIEEVSKPITYENQQCRVGCSVGIAISLHSSTQPERLILDADIALNEAKKLGRGRYEFVTHELTDRFHSMELLKDGLLRGLEKDRIIPYFQPQICGVTGNLVGVEALARWKQTDGSIRNATSFISAAEELNLLEKIERVVIEKGLRSYANWKSAGIQVPRIAFNLSMAKLKDEGFLPWMESQIQALNLEPSSVAIEILESVALDESSSHTIRNITSLKERGFSIELDDFGSSHASINSLLRLSVDRIKIDRSLIQKICEDSNSQILLDAIIQITTRLGIETLAEGVETIEQVNQLAKMHSFTYQGHYFAAPMSDLDFASWFENHHQHLTSEQSSAFPSLVCSDISTTQQIIQPVT